MSTEPGLWCDGDYARERVAVERGKEAAARRKTDAKHGTRAYICALDREICQVGKDGELGCQTVGEGFSLICQKIMDGEGICQTVGDALKTESWRLTHTLLPLWIRAGLGLG